ncbi:hypothetical protein O23A_p0657 [Aeromonas salmonicida]|nr:hypothetical protein O23A_p0657 [Aeromonas salmonicida]
MQWLGLVPWLQRMYLIMQLLQVIRLKYFVMLRWKND